MGGVGRLTARTCEKRRKSVDICKTCGWERDEHEHGAWRCPDYTDAEGAMLRGFLNTGFTAEEAEPWPVRAVSGGRVGEVQAAIVSALNQLGAAVAAGAWEPIESSPVPDDEVARVLAEIDGSVR